MKPNMLGISNIPILKAMILSTVTIDLSYTTRILGINIVVWGRAEMLE